MAETVQRMAWAAARGGAHGRRREAAFGRFMAWYVTAMLSQLPWPADAEELGVAASRLKWYRWDEGDQGWEKGWVLRLAIEDETRGWSTAVAATDLLEEPAE